MVQSQYPTHLPLRPWQKAVVAVASGFGAAFNPYRADLVAAANETLGESAFDRVHRSMQKNPSGRSILEEKPLITNATLDECRGMDSGSLGAEYAKFMDSRRLKPDDRPPVRFINDAEVAYVATRYRQVHDLWHTIFGCSTNMPGEIAVKTIEAIQLGLPNAMLAPVLSPLLIGSRERAWFYTDLLPWAVRNGFGATDLMSIYYERHFKASNQYLSAITVGIRSRMMSMISEENGVLGRHQCSHKHETNGTQTNREFEEIIYHVDITRQ